MKDKKTLKDLKEYLNKTKDAIIILGSKATNDVINSLTDKEKEEMMEKYTNKFFRRNNKEFWEMYYRLFDKDKYEVSEAAKIASELLDKGLVKRIYYQDIDGSLQGENILHVKGSINRFKCTKPNCNEVYSFEELKNIEDKKCLKCKKQIRPTHSFIGEAYSSDLDFMLEEDLDTTHVVITIGLDLSEDFLVELVEYFDKKRFEYELSLDKKIKNKIALSEKEKIDLNKMIVAIHNEDKNKVDYNELFKCDFQALGDINASTKRLYEGIV